MWYVLLITGILLILLSGYKIVQTKNIESLNTKTQAVINKEKGDDFEDFMIRKIKNKVTRFTDKSSDYMKDGIYSEDNQTPDLKFKKKWNSKTYPFAVECKYRSQFNENDVIIWSKEKQIENYKQFQNETDQPVFVSIGIGGTPKDPEHIYMIPLNRLPKPYAYKSYLDKYEIDSKRPFFYNHKKQLFHNPLNN